MWLVETEKKLLIQNMHFKINIFSTGEKKKKNAYKFNFE